MKFSIASVIVPRAGAIVHVHHRLPGDAGRCLSVGFTASKVSADKALAAAGISFNGGKDKTINQFVFNKGSFTRPYEGISVNQKLIQGTDVLGYVEDLSAGVVYPYTVKIYFELN